MSEKIRNSSASYKNDDGIDIGKLIGSVVDSRWLILSITSLFMVASVLYVLFATPIYQSDSIIQVEQSSGNSILNNISQMLPDTQPASLTEIELIKSRMVLGKTIDDLNLNTEIKQKYFPVFGEGFARLTNEKEGKVAASRLKVPTAYEELPILLESLGNGKYKIEIDGADFLEGKIGNFEQKNGFSILVSDIDASDGTTFTIKSRPTLETINFLLSRLNIEDKGKDTGILSLTYTDESPEEATRVLQSIDNNYVLQNVERKSEEAAKSLEFLKQQLPTVRSSLDEAETKLNVYRQANDSVDLSLEAKSVLDTIVSVESQLNELTFKEAEISKLYTKQHPAYRALMEKRQTLEQERDKLNKRVGKMPKTQQEILRLTRDVQSGQEIYMQLMNKQQELSITKASTVGNVRIIDSAVTQLKPVQPKKKLIVIIAIFLGLLSSIGVVLLKTFLHRGIENPDQLEQEGLNVYASIPLSDWQQKRDRERITQLGGKKSNTRSTRLLSVENPTDLAIEAIRALRTSLHFAMLEAKNKTLVITGASPNIGKTFVSTNLASIIAQSDNKVLLIDADMRKGYSHALLGMSQENGLSDILSKKLSVQDAIKKTDIPGLDFISRGQIPPNPSELLMRPSFTEMVEWADGHYDIILIDTPPILAVTDSAIIGQLAGTILMVARFGVNTVKEIEASYRRFDQNGIEVKGVILNAVEKRASSQYGDYGYYHYEYKSDKN